MSQLLIVYSAMSGEELEDSLQAAGVHAQVIASFDKLGAFLVKVLTEPSDLGDVARRLRASNITAFQSRPLESVGHWRRMPGMANSNELMPSAPNNPPSNAVTIAVLDAHGFFKHAVFGNRLTTFDASNGSVTPGAPPPKLGESEGTAVASVAAGGDPCMGPASDCSVWGFLTKETAHMVAAIDFILASNQQAGPEGKKVRVIVTAWKVRLREDELVSDVGFELALAKLDEAGVLFVTAGGNTGTIPEEPMHPLGTLPNVLTVGGFEDNRPSGADAGDTVHEDSTRGPEGSRKPDVLAPYANWIVAPEVPELNVHGGRGTSLAAAYVAGLLAKVISANDDLTRAGVSQLLARSGVCQDLGAPINAQGFGALNPAEVEAQVILV